MLLLSPSRGLGGGIERYVATLEWAFAAEGVECRRLDLSEPGARAHARLLTQARAILRAGSEPARLVVAHRSLLPVAALLARDSAACGVSVLCYGSEMWGSRWRPRREPGAPPDARCWRAGGSGEQFHRGRASEGLSRYSPAAGLVARVVRHTCRSSRRRGRALVRVSGW